MTQDWAYTAFGEPADLGGTGDTRYRYAGDWGYEANPDIGAGGVGFPFLHVGARWYDPETGRFLQRDPIGIGGGLNVYEYVYARPSSFVNFSGSIPIEPGSSWDRQAGFGAGLDGKTRKVAIGVGVGLAAAGVGLPLVADKMMLCARPWFRIEAHQLGGARRLGRLWHINVGKKHIIIDLRYWWDRLTGLW